MPSDKLIKLALADDHSLFLQGLSLIIKQYPGFHIAATVSNGVELLKVLENTEVDIVITDLNMPLMDGLTCCTEIALKYPEIKTVVVTFENGKRIEPRLKLLGVKGFFNKEVDPEVLLEKLRIIADGGCVFSPDLKDGASGKQNFKLEGGGSISCRELEIISLITEGYTSAEIADRLFISIHTVSQHRKNLLQKLKLKNVSELVAFAMKNQLYSI